MGLADYRPETAPVKFKGGSVEVRGLNLDDVALLVRTHMPDMEAIFALYKQSAEDVFADGAANQFIFKLVTDAPALAANLIALAADEPASADNARKLPISVQVKALGEIGRLTFEDAGGPKEFFESLTTLMGGLSLPDAAKGHRAGSKKTKQKAP